uniref:Uncharacterized protein n=1 Tax=Panagrolaimus davidi TaxID=227884 RepID=A0A914PVW2_9BILA
MLEDQNPFINVSEITIAESCGKDKFPYGIYINPATKKPMMYCIKHQCSNSKNAKCIKNSNDGHCSRNNEWISGFIFNKNNNNSFISAVECCKYKNIKFTAFVKTIYFSTSQIYANEIFDETKNELNFINNVKKIQTLDLETIFSGSVFRMKCIPQKVVETVETKPENREISNVVDTKNKTSVASPVNKNCAVVIATPENLYNTETTKTSPPTKSTTIFEKQTTSVLPETTATVYNTPIVFRVEKSPNMKFKI